MRRKLILSQRTFLKITSLSIVFVMLMAGGVLLITSHIPTNVFALQLNFFADLPVGFLSHDHEIDKSMYTSEPMFGGTAYTRGTGDDMLEFHTSPWPDLSDKDLRVTYIRCTDPEYSVFGLSIGDSAIKGMLTLAAFRFLPTNIESGEARFQKWGIAIVLNWDLATYTLTSIRIHSKASNEKGILF